MIRFSTAFAALTSALACSLASAVTVVTPTAMQGWSVETYGTSTPAPFGGITNAYPHLGNGSAEIRLADEGTTEVDWFYQLPTPQPLANLAQLSFDWYVSRPLRRCRQLALGFAMYLNSPGGGRFIIWEGAYNGTSGGATQDAWVSSEIVSDKFWLAGAGTGDCAGAAKYDTLSFFNATCFNNEATVESLVPFLGNGYAGTVFDGAFDNVSYGFTNGPAERFNFELSARSDVPEPTSMALIVVALAALVAAGRKKAR